MALIIEDGSIVDNANSFVAAVELAAYATLRGVTITADTAKQESLLILAMDYIFNSEPNMKGERVTQGQLLPYPRVDVSFHGFYINNNTIPVQLKNAQIELAIQAGASDILISETTSNLASFNVDGVYSESYFSGGSYSTVRTDKADAYLDVLMINGGSNNILQRI